MNIQAILTEKQREAFSYLFEPVDITSLEGGARSGKTFSLCAAYALMAMYRPSRHLILRKFLSNLIGSVWLDTMPKVLNLLEIPEKAYKFRADRYYIDFVNGSQIWFGGLDNNKRADKRLGFEYSTIWINEASEFDEESIPLLRTRLAENSGLYNKLFLDFNPPEDSHWTHDLIFESLLNGQKVNCNHLLMNPGDNRKNLPAHYIKMLEDLPERQRKRFLLGEFVTPDETLFHAGMFRPWYEKVTYQTAIIGLDPAATNKPKSDETGIISVGASHGVPYIDNDLSCKAAPEYWADKVITEYIRLSQKSVYVCIVGEVNQGGDMVRAVIERAAKARGIKVNYKAVTTQVSKFYRAEEFSVSMALDNWRYIADHETALKPLFKQMLGYGSMIANKKSPDRVDALIIGASQLMQGKRNLFYFAS